MIFETLLNWKRELRAAMSAKFVELDRKHALVSFRTIITLLVVFQSLYGQKPFHSDIQWNVNFPLWLLAASSLHLLSNVLLFSPLEKRFKKGLTAILFVFDIVLVSTTIYLTQGFESDLYLIYFLVVFMTVLARRPSLSFLVAAVACLLYGVLYLKVHDVGDLFEAAIIIRFSLLWIVAFFSSVVVEDLEAQDEWVSVISHELRSPLAAIKTATNLTLGHLRGEKPRLDPATQLKMLTIIDRNTTKINAMVDEILDAFRMQIGNMKLRPEHFSIAEMARECVEEFTIPCRERGIALSSEIEERLPLVVGDPQRLGQALSNLIGNAMKFTPREGTIVVGARMGRSAGLFESSEKAWIELFVEDTGIGISQEQQKKIFNKFYQVKERSNVAKPGLGLGLTLVKAVIEAHKGSVSVKSAPEKGSRFTLTIPLKNAPSRQEAEKQDRGNALAHALNAGAGAVAASRVSMESLGAAKNNFDKGQSHV